MWNSRQGDSRWHPRSLPGDQARRRQAEDAGPRAAGPGRRRRALRGCHPAPRGRARRGPGAAAAGEPGARRELARLLRLFPGEVELWHMRYQATSFAKDYAGAWAALGKMRALEPAHPFVHAAEVVLALLAAADGGGARSGFDAAYSTLRRGGAGLRLRSRGIPVRLRWTGCRGRWGRRQGGIGAGACRRRTPVAGRFAAIVNRREELSNRRTGAAGRFGWDRNLQHIDGSPVRTPGLFAPCEPGMKPCLRRMPFGEVRIVIASRNFHDFSRIGPGRALWHEAHEEKLSRAPSFSLSGMSHTPTRRSFFGTLIQPSFGGASGRGIGRDESDLHRSATRLPSVASASRTSP